MAEETRTASSEAIARAQGPHEVAFRGGLAVLGRWT